MDLIAALSPAAPASPAGTVPPILPGEALPTLKFAALVTSPPAPAEEPLPLPDAEPPPCIFPAPDMPQAGDAPAPPPSGTAPPPPPAVTTPRPGLRGLPLAGLVEASALPAAPPLAIDAPDAPAEQAASPAASRGRSARAAPRAAAAVPEHGSAPAPIALPPAIAPVATPLAAPVIARADPSPPDVPADTRTNTAAAIAPPAVPAAPAPPEAPRAAPVPTLPAAPVPAAVEHVAPSHAPATSARHVTLDDAFGSRIGLAIAHRIDQGGDQLIVRMEPAELGRIHVRLSFDEQGSLRAALVAESPVVVETLRREAGELARALSDAGVRTDAQSFSFNREGQGQRGQSETAWARWQARQDERPASPDAGSAALPDRPVRRSGRLDLMA